MGLKVSALPLCLEFGMLLHPPQAHKSFEIPRISKCFQGQPEYLCPRCHWGGHPGQDHLKVHFPRGLEQMGLVKLTPNPQGPSITGWGGQSQENSPVRREMGLSAWKSSVYAYSSVLQFSCSLGMNSCTALQNA